MSLTTEDRAGRVLGLISAVGNAGSLAAMLVVLVAFQTGWLTYRSPPSCCAARSRCSPRWRMRELPNLRDSQAEPAVLRREPIVLRREYKYYYLLSLLDGGRQQIFFSFGLWVLVSRYGLQVPTISAILIVVTT